MGYIPPMLSLILVFAGGGTGAVARYLTGLAAMRAFGGGFPVATIAVNVAGSFAMGLLIGVLARRAGEVGHIHLLVATGFLGGFTTFSAFSLDAAFLWQRGDVQAAIVYVFGSVILSLLAVVAGLAVMRFSAGGAV